MKWPFFFFMAFFPLTLVAQEEIPLPIDTLIFVDSIPLGKAKFLKKNIEAWEFKKGETILFSFQEADGKGISKIKVIVDETDFVAMILKETANTGLIELPIHTSSNYTFRLINRVLFWPKTRRYAMGIWKQIQLEPVLPIKDFVAFDTTWCTFKDSLITLDTFWLPLLDERIAIHPKQDLHALPRSVVELTLPEKIDRWYYWLGVGPEAVTLYEQWSIALSEVSLSPLHAHAARLVPDLPTNGSGNRINYYFTENNGHKKFLSTGKVNNEVAWDTMIRTAYNQIEKDTIREEKKYLCLENAEIISNVNVQIKVLGRSIKRNVLFFQDSTAGPIQARIKLDTAGRTPEEIAYILHLYERSIDVARKAREEYPVPIGQIGREVDSLRRVYLDSPLTPLIVTTADTLAKDTLLTGTNSTLEGLRKEIKIVENEVDSLPKTIEDEKKFQSLAEALDTIKPKVDSIDKRVGDLIKEYRNKENQDSIIEFVSIVDETLDQIIELEADIVRLQNQARHKQSLEAMIFSDSVNVLEGKLTNIRTLSDSSELKSINWTIDSLENAVIALGKEHSDSTLISAIVQGSIEQINNRYIEIKKTAKSIKKDVKTVRQINRDGIYSSSDWKKWIKKLEELRQSLQVFIRDYRPPPD